MAETWVGYAGGNNTGFGISTSYRVTGASFTTTKPVDAVRFELTNYGSFVAHLRSGDGATLISSSEVMSAPGASRGWVTYTLPTTLAPGTYRVNLAWVSGSVTWVCATTESYAGSTAYGSTGSVIANRDYNMQYREYVPASGAKRWTGSGWTTAAIKKFDGSGWVTPEITVTH